MSEGEYAQFVGKLVRLKLNRGILKGLVGVLIGEDSGSIRVSELYSMNHFYVRTILKTQIASLQTLDLATGNWPED